MKLDVQCSLVGDAVTEVVQHFFEGEELPRVLNHTFVALVPKSDTATKVEQFRPI